MGKGNRLGCFALLWIFASRVILVLCVDTTLESGPQNKTVFEGQRTSFICDFNDDNERNILWVYISSSGRQRYVSFNDLIYQFAGIDINNYEIVIDQSKQSYELVFKQAQNSPDDGKYQCGYEYGQYRQYKAVHSVYLTVLPMTDSRSCQFTYLPMISTNQNQEVEVMCSWSNNQTTHAEFVHNGQPISADLNSSDRIISRVVLGSSNEIPNFTCSVTLNNNGNPMSTVISCSNSNEYNSDNQGIVRVDPFVNEVSPGSNALFNCSTGDQNYITGQHWNMVNDERNSLLTEGRRVDSRDHMNILDVRSSDEILLVECRASLQGEMSWVSSYAAIRIVAVLTTIMPKPPDHGQSTDSYERPSTSPNRIVDSTPSIDNGNQTMVSIIVPMVIIIFIIIMLVISVSVFIIKRKTRSRHIKSKEKTHTNQNYDYDTIKLQEIPHTVPNDGISIYTLSFKDKSVRRHQSVDIDALQDGQKPRFDSLHSKSCGSLHMLSKESADVVYAMPDVDVTSRGLSKDTSSDFLRPTAKSRSLPLLDNNEYETVSVTSNESICKSDTMSVKSAMSNPGDRRWMSQRVRKDIMVTPPRARHALSFRQPPVANPSISSDYTKMKIEHNAVEDGREESAVSSVPVYAKPDKSQKKNRKCPTEETSEGLGEHIAHTALLAPVLDDNNREYADNVKALDKPQDTDSKELVDTYLGSLPDSLHTLPGLMKNNKCTSLQRTRPRTQTPQKPPRGKCQSEFLRTAAYSSISDYEIMATQVKVHVNVSDCNECDSQTGHLVSRYDEIPKRSTIPSKPNTLPKITEDSSKMMQKHAHNSKQRTMADFVTHNDYEMVGDDSVNDCDHERGDEEISEPLQSPQYADINDVMYASVDDIGVGV